MCTPLYVDVYRCMYVNVRVEICVNVRADGERIIGCSVRFVERKLFFPRKEHARDPFCFS